MRLRVAATALILILGSAMSPMALAATDTAYVAVAANFSRPMQTLVKRFEQRTDFAIRMGTASTGTLYAQIRHGAPYDLFLAADAARPRQLEKAGLTVPGSRLTYAIGELALWAPGRHGVTKQTLRQAAFDHLAIANPAIAPYGAAAKQALIHLKLWRELRPRVVRGESINQAWQFVTSGNAALGLVARSEVIDAPAATVWLVPQELYSPLKQQAVLLKRGSDNPAARAFLHFLKRAARPIIGSFGYRLGSEP